MTDAFIEVKLFDNGRIERSQSPQSLFTTGPVGMSIHISILSEHQIGSVIPFKRKHLKKFCKGWFVIFSRGFYKNTLIML